MRISERDKWKHISEYIDVMNQLAEDSENLDESKKISNEKFEFLESMYKVSFKHKTVRPKKFITNQPPK